MYYTVNYCFKFSTHLVILIRHGIFWSCDLYQNLSKYFLMYSLARVSRLVYHRIQLLDCVSRLLACARVKTVDVGLSPLIII